MPDAEPTALNTLELTVPVAARASGEDQWQASMDLPRELLGLDREVVLSVLAAVEASLSELQRLNLAAEDRRGLAWQPWLRIGCGLWMRRLPNGQWRTSVSFSWPESWAEFTRDGRAAVLAAMLTMTGNAQAAVSERAADRA